MAVGAAYRFARIYPTNGGAVRSADPGVGVLHDQVANLSLHESWFSAPAVLDTRSGRVQPLPFDGNSDYNSMAWLPSGKFMALRTGMRSTLWRFAPSDGARLPTAN